MPPATELERLQRAGRNLDRALTAVALGALAFSTVNVALLAISHGVPVWIAWLLEPLVGIALWAVLSSDAVLSRYGASGGVWAWTLRAFTGLVTLILNIWSSVFTTRSTGQLEVAPDPAGILLHSIAPVLLILLAEAAPRYRAQFAAITARLESAAPTRPHTPDRSTPAPAVPGAHPTAAHNTPQAPTATARSADAADQGNADDAAGSEPAADTDDAPPSPPSASAPAAVEGGTAAGPQPDPTRPKSPASSPDSNATHPGPPPLYRSGPEPGSSPDPRRHSKKQRRREQRARNDARARAILLVEPDITGAELARRLGVETRSGQRILHRVTHTND